VRRYKSELVRGHWFGHEWSIFEGNYGLFSKKTNALKSQNFKIWLQKYQAGNPA